MLEIIGCPVSTTLDIIGKKWSINIINDLLFGKTRFNELLEVNPNLSPKILSTRLKDLEEFSVIEKKITSVTPVRVEYYLTQKGKNLRRILFELALFAALNEPNKVLSNPEAEIEEVISLVGKMYDFSSNEIETYTLMNSIPELST